MKCKNVSYTTDWKSINVYYDGEYRGFVEQTVIANSLMREMVARISELEAKTDELEKQVEFLLAVPKDATWESLTNDSTRQYKTIKALRGSKNEETN